MRTKEEIVKEAHEACERHWGYSIPFLIEIFADIRDLLSKE